MNIVASCTLHTFESLPRYSPLLAYSLFTTHQDFIFFASNPSFFWFSRGRSRRPLLGNLISWVNAKKWVCSIRQSTLFRTIAVVQWARNLANTNMISSACPGSWQNAEIVWLLQQRKIPQVKNTTRGSFTATPTCLADMGLDTSEQLHKTGKN